MKRLVLAVVSGAMVCWIPAAWGQRGGGGGSFDFQSSGGRGSGQPALPANIFDLGRERAQRVIVTFGEKTPTLDEAASPMLCALAGVAADLKGKPLEELRACVPPNPMMGDVRGAERAFSVHVIGRKDRKRVDVLRERDGNCVAIEAVEGAAAPARAELKRDAFAALASGWTVYQGPFDAASVNDKRGEVFELEKPYTAGKATIDQATLSSRFHGGRKVTIDGSARELETEKLFVRLPKSYDPRTPAGLVVWVDPTPSGRPPEAFDRALDELNLVCIGAADSGNTRVVSTRYQLALDGVATAERRFHIDPRRVYITGVSGGGRVSSILLACFPEVFAGAVPIVGLSYYANVPTGTGKMWPAAFARPRADRFTLFKTRRMAGITGNRDFNQLEMQQATELYRRDGAQVKLFEYPKMGHQMPEPDHFKEALVWVDEPWQKAREAERTAAKEALEEALARAPESGRVPDATRKLLVKVTEAGPWTDEAWRAVELLKR